MKFKISKSAKTALDILHKNGYEAYIVGGSVRDMYLGHDAHDFDITTNALPDITKELFKSYTVVETGIKHGTVTAVIDRENIEITTYRQEGEYTDSRHPDRVEFTTSLPLDLGRRDFTVNALAYDGKEEIVDLFGGAEDIKRRIIRAIGVENIKTVLSDCNPTIISAIKDNLPNALHIASPFAWQMH